jgi:hypothetical protein
MNMRKWKKIVHGSHATPIQENWGNLTQKKNSFHEIGVNGHWNSVHTKWRGRNHPKKYPFLKN